MPLCHGSGNLDSDSCCWVGGQVCPLRLKIVNGRVLRGPALTDIGTPADVGNALAKGRDRQRITDHVAPVSYACMAAVEALAADSARQTDRAALNAAWDTHPDYVRLVRPHWAQIEAERGLPAGSYQCSTWRGTGGPQCCFAEAESTNEAKAASLSAVAVEVRRAGGV